MFGWSVKKCGFNGGQWSKTYQLITAVFLAWREKKEVINAVRKQFVCKLALNDRLWFNRKQIDAFKARVIF